MQVRDDAGASAVEYSIIVAGIAAVFITALYGIGAGVQQTFDRVNAPATWNTPGAPAAPAEPTSVPGGSSPTGTPGAGE